MGGIRVPLVVEGREIVVTASVGIARNAPGDDGESLLRNADIAMYGAKKKGKDRYEIYDPQIGVQERERLTLESDLRRAVEREEFEVHYQPKLSLLTGGVAGVEALVRWRHPKRGLVPPREFITLAEETGLIIPIGLWVLEAACRDVRAWQTHLLPEASLEVSVNLSAKQFGSEDLVGEVGRVLARTGLGPTHLTLEITENVIMDDAPSTIGTLEDLRGLGVHLAIDDFGTGYSSLSYLRRFPLDYLKIDRSFVAGLGEEADASAVVSGIVSLARSLRLAVVAEGVENAEQLSLLKDLGCDLAQGYYLSEPLPAHDVPAFVVRTPADAPVPLRRSHA
jgi:EAL domain-containing protein (putative c-di-GMP-specific phosphodiesterase class I)